MYNIQKAVSRLNFAPKLKEIEIVDIKKGLGVFTPKAGQPVSFAVLKAALKKAGYALDTAEITVSGTLARDDKGWAIIADPAGQRFALEGTTVEHLLAGNDAGARVELTGDWKTSGTGAAAHEAVAPRTVKKAEGTLKKATALMLTDAPAMRFIPARFDAARAHPSIALAANTRGPVLGVPLAPIRTTSPGLTVYKGGAVVPRLYLIKQHLGNLEVNRQLLDVSLSYTPSQRVQLEAEVPFSRTSFDDGRSSGSGAGLGNVTLWAKYRFYRSVKTYGDRQAAARFGLELPTGKKDSPAQAQLAAAAFVRQQLTPINGGLSPHFDAAFSQAGGRLIFGGNVETIFRSERDGYRVGHEARVNTDLEYVLLPLDYPKPGGELFAILETTFIHRGEGRVRRAAVPGSRTTEYYLSPGLQYAAAPRFVIEGSIQLPVIRHTGPQALRTDHNILLGVRYLF